MALEAYGAIIARPDELTAAIVEYQLMAGEEDRTDSDGSLFEIASDYIVRHDIESTVGFQQRTLPIETHALLLTIRSEGQLGIFRSSVREWRRLMEYAGLFEDQPKHSGCLLVLDTVTKSQIESHNIGVTAGSFFRWEYSVRISTEFLGPQKLPLGNI